MSAHYLVFSKEKCPYCEAAIKLLEQKGLSFTVSKVGDDITRDTLLQFSPMKTVPVIFELVGGFGQLKDKLDGKTNG